MVMNMAEVERKIQELERKVKCLENKVDDLQLVSIQSSRGKACINVYACTVKFNSGEAYLLQQLTRRDGMVDSKSRVLLRDFGYEKRLVQISVMVVYRADLITKEDVIGMIKDQYNPAFGVENERTITCLKRENLDEKLQPLGNDDAREEVKTIFNAFANDNPGLF